MLKTTSLAEYLTNARETLTAGEIYQDMVDDHLIPPCPTTVTESTMDAIYYHVIGDREVSERSYANASTFTSPHGDPQLRQQWLRGVLDAL
ncbi:MULTISPECIES: hypothetical protein [unclassified Microcoleus]|uniref:hypothetical protein n=1 Tax=unclassified Microcoleus TaxID=2642155 RepID=UPI002FD15E6C